MLQVPIMLAIGTPHQIAGDKCLVRHAEQRGVRSMLSARSADHFP